MLWMLVTLQVMTPFIHAHAGVEHLDRTGALHAYADAHGDTVYHANAAGEHGTEVSMAQAMPLRRDMPAADVPLAMVLALPSVLAIARPGTGFSAPPPLFLALPDHTLPHTLAPPLA